MLFRIVPCRFGTSIGDIFGVYPPLSYPRSGGVYHIPLSLIPEQGVLYVREGGIPENTALGAMMARGPLHDGIVLLFRGVALRPNLVG